MADESQASVQPEVKDKLKSAHYLARFDSAILYGIAGVILSGVAIQASFMPSSIGNLPMNIAVGSALFIAEWVRGIAGY
jgi:hypothetical protein